MSPGSPLLARSGNVESQRGGIPKPAELYEALAPPDPDPAIADAMFEALTQGTEAARRLALAVDWLDVAWRNTDSISQTLRILAVASGFEALLMEGEFSEGRRMAYAYDKLLGETDPPTRTFTNRAGKATSAEFSDKAWWLFRFYEIRSAIAHGDALADDALAYEDGRPHFAIGEQRLREAILITAQNMTGHDDLLLTRFERDIGRATEEWFRERREQEAEGGDARNPRRGCILRLPRALVIFGTRYGGLI